MTEQQELTFDCLGGVHVWAASGYNQCELWADRGRTVELSADVDSRDADHHAPGRSSKPRADAPTDGAVPLTGRPLATLVLSLSTLLPCYNAGELCGHSPLMPQYRCLKEIASELGLATRSMRRWVKRLNVPPDIKAGPDLWSEKSVRALYRKLKERQRSHVPTLTTAPKP